MSGLGRTLGTTDAVAIGLGSMIGAGVFVVWAPAARAAGSWLLVGLLLAGVVAVCNAWSSAALAVRYPSAGGSYVYGRERIGPWAGHLAGWAFVVGKTASCAAMAMAVGAYAAPGRERLAAVVAVVVVVALNTVGVHRSATVSRVVVTVVLAVLTGALVAGLVGGARPVADLVAEVGAGPGPGLYGVLQAAGLIFFAFAGYARLATLAEEVTEPERTIPRAVLISVSVVLVVYLVVGAVTLGLLGPEHLAVAPDPVAAAAATVLAEPWVWALRAVAALAALGALLNLLLGVSRTSLAMARDGHLPRGLATVGVRGVPVAAEVTVGAVVLVVILLADLRGAIGFSSFGVLTYYAVANASAWTLRDWRWGRVVPVIGFTGCLLLAGTLPWPSVVAGAAVLLTGAVAFAVTSRSRGVEASGRQKVPPPG